MSSVFSVVDCAFAFVNRTNYGGHRRIVSKGLHNRSPSNFADLTVVQNADNNDSADDISRSCQHQPPQIFAQLALPARTAEIISPLVTTQCENFPTPTTKVRNHTIASWPIVHWLAVTTQATKAISHPPITPLQKMCAPEPCRASLPNPQVDWRFREERSRFDGQQRKSKAPTILEVNTTPHKRRVSKCSGARPVPE